MRHKHYQKESEQTKSKYLEASRYVLFAAVREKLEELSSDDVSDFSSSNDLFLSGLKPQHKVLVIADREKYSKS